MLWREMNIMSMHTATSIIKCIIFLLVVNDFFFVAFMLLFIRILFIWCHAFIRKISILNSICCIFSHQHRYRNWMFLSSSVLYGTNFVIKYICNNYVQFRYVILIVMMIFLCRNCMHAWIFATENCMQQ